MSLFPLPVFHGERVRVRGPLSGLDSQIVPLTRRFAPTSPRKRGEVKVDINPLVINDLCGKRGY